jgi:hypothetical protein
VPDWSTLPGRFKEVEKMAAPRKRGQVVPLETSQSIADQTAEFIKSGGKVEQVPRGVSGQTSLAARKHITISTKA